MAATLGVDTIQHTNGTTAVTVGTNGSVTAAGTLAVTGATTLTGNVGIGETSPSGARLTVKSTSSFPNNDGGAQLYIMDQGATSSRSAALGVRVNTVHTGTDAALITVENGSSSCIGLRIDNRGTGNTFNFDNQFSMTSDGRGLSQFTAKAWVNFNGTGTVAIRDSHNVSSITDNGTGDYTVNFSNNMANVNYSTTYAGGQKTVTWGVYLGYSSYGSAVGSHRFFNVTPGDTVTDTSFCSLMFFGD